MRLDNFRLAYNDLQNRMLEKHESIEKKHQIQSSNVDITKNILSEYRQLRNEEASLKKAEWKDNFEKER